MTPVIERSLAPVSCGPVHIAACGAGRPILLLHQMPRSWDEFHEVLPLLGGKHRAIDMDTVGFGDSAPLPGGADPHAYPHASRLAAAIAGSKLVEIENGMVPLPDQMPREFAAAVNQFLSELPPPPGH